MTDYEVAWKTAQVTIKFANQEIEKLEQQNAEMVAVLEMARPFTELALRAVQIRQLKKQNAARVAALEEIEILGRNIRSTLATSMGNIARQALAQGGDA